MKPKVVLGCTDVAWDFTNNCGEEIIYPKSKGKQHNWGLCTVCLRQLLFWDSTGFWAEQVNRSKSLVNKMYEFNMFELSGDVNIALYPSYEKPKYFTKNGLGIGSVFQMKTIRLDFSFENKTRKVIEVTYGMKEKTGIWIYKTAEVTSGKISNQDNWDNKEIYIKFVKEKQEDGSWKNIWTGSVAAAIPTTIEYDGDKLKVNGKVSL